MCHLLGLRALGGGLGGIWRGFKVFVIEGGGEGRSEE